MKFKQIVDEYQFESVWNKLVDIYPDQKKSKQGYKKVWAELKTLTPDSREHELVITIEHVVDDLIPEEVEEYEHVSGYSAEDDESYAIEFTPWEQWLNMDVSEETRKRLSEIEIAAYCLWEMTWSGFDQKEIKDEIDEIMGRVEEIKSGNAKTLSLDEVKEKLGK